MWSAGVREIRREISSPLSVEIEAGASSSFSCRRETVTTSWLSVNARERSSMVTETEPPASTVTPSVRDVSYPIRVTRTECVPAGTERRKAPDSSLATGPSGWPRAWTEAFVTGAPVSMSVTRPVMVPCCAATGVKVAANRAATRAFRASADRGFIACSSRRPLQRA